MPINIYTVTNELSDKGWKLISNSYKNLNTELEMECPKGHTQLITFGQWRKHPICEECLCGDTKKLKKNSVPIKKIGTFRVVALDAATSITGYSIYDDGDLVNYGVFKADKDLTTDARINQVKKWLEENIKKWQPDFIGLENIQLQKYGDYQFQVETYRKLANLQGVLIDTLYENNIAHDLVSVNTWRNYCNVGDGIGRENKKKQAQEKVKMWYNEDCTQDEADAICIGKYFAHSVKKMSNWGEKIDD